MCTDVDINKLWKESDGPLCTGEKHYDILREQLNPLVAYLADLNMCIKAKKCSQAILVEQKNLFCDDVTGELFDASEWSDIVENIIIREINNVQKDVKTLTEELNLIESAYNIQLWWAKIKIIQIPKSETTQGLKFLLTHLYQLGFVDVPTGKVISKYNLAAYTQTKTIATDFKLNENKYHDQI